MKDKSLYRFPNDFAEDLDKFCEVIAGYEKGTVSAEEFTAFRGPRGVCEEKESGKFMVRSRLPGGMVLPEQLRAMAEMSKKYGNSSLHLSTRECIQIHGIPLSKLSAALRELLNAGLSGKASTGNSPRNITTCPNTGICKNECFDVTPFSIGLTEFMLTPSLMRKLPRKYKIALSGCCHDCGGATVNDLGLVAIGRNGERGFTVYAGGGLGPKARVGDCLEPFVPVSEIHLIAEAVKRVLDKHGDRENRAKARLRHLVERVGFETFRTLYQQELAEVKSEALPVPDYSFSLNSVPATSSASETDSRPDGFDRWTKCNVTAQKQPGLFAVEIPVRLGDISAATVIFLADIVEKNGEGCLRVTPRQNFQLRGVCKSKLPRLYTELNRLGLADTTPSSYRDIVSCIGNQTCRRGVCFSRGLAGAVMDTLIARGPKLDDEVKLTINISGCPSSCGRHQIADIGFTCVMRKIDSHAVPHYVLHLGGHLEVGKTRLGKEVGAIPARNIPAFLVEYLQAFKDSKQYPDFALFLAAEGEQIAESLTEKYQAVPSYEESPAWYNDYGINE